LQDEETTSEAEAAPATPLTLEERVAFLEAQNEGLKRVGLLGLVLVMLLGAILVHQTYSDLKSSTTRGLTLLNDQDQLSGAVTVDGQGRMQFLQARYGVMAPATELPADFRGFAFYDSDGAARILMGEGKDKQTIFMVTDPVRGVAFDPFEKVKAAPTRPGTPAVSPTPAPPATSPSPQVSPAQP
jgi:hypothetical protein